MSSCVYVFCLHAPASRSWPGSRTLRSGPSRHLPTAVAGLPLNSAPSLSHLFPCCLAALACRAGEHNPVEDARAAMDLALLKFEKGPAYGAANVERGDRLLDVLGEHGR